MEKLLKFIVGSIVQKPDEVEVVSQTPTFEGQEKGKFINFILKVNPEDLKIVIGKKGRTIRAIRNLLRLRAIKEKVQVNLQLEDETHREEPASPAA